MVEVVETDTRIARHVFAFVNGQILVFDDAGQQIPDLQGSDTNELRLRIMMRSDDATVWKEGVRWSARP